MARLPLAIPIFASAIQCLQAQTLAAGDGTGGCPQSLGQFTSIVGRYRPLVILEAGAGRGGSPIGIKCSLALRISRKSACMTELGTVAAKTRWKICARFRGVCPSRPLRFGGPFIVRIIRPSICVSPGGENRAIAGLSMGGGQSLRIGLGHVDLFSAAAASRGGRNGEGPGKSDDSLERMVWGHNRLRLRRFSTRRKCSGGYPGRPISPVLCSMLAAYCTYSQPAI
jgi:hypothetical protein